MEAGMKLECELSADRITNLPVDVIQQILVRLPIKDAAKTSILSTKWRHHWRCIPELVFDLDFASEDVRWESEEMMNKLMANIYKILLRHDGPIRKFQVLVPCLKHDDFDQVILHLSNDPGLQELDLDYYSLHTYKVHSSLFSCLHLNRLRLRCCELIRQPSWFVGFSKLTVLVLRRVTLPSDFYENFLPKYCPMLKTLKAIYSEGPSTLEIVAPRLEKFDFLCSRYKLQKIYFKCTPRLSRVRLRTDGNVDKVIDTVDFSTSPPALEWFYVGVQFLQSLVAGDSNVPTRLPNPLHQLQFLTVSSLDLGCLKNVCAVVSLIMSSPNMRQLIIELDTKQHPAKDNDVVPSIETLLGAEDRSRSGCCLQHLKVFKIEKIHGIQIELDLVRFILATAPLLQRVHITSAAKLEPRMASEFMEKVMQLKRVSKEVQVTYADNHEKLTETS